MECPKCNAAFHTDAADRRLPKPGDRVLCKYGGWQYFDATILTFDEDKLEYYIEWDDQDPEGRYIHFQDLALNKPPDENQLGVGSAVLFHQGTYGANVDLGRLAGVRWHQGKITSIETNDLGEKLYCGVHTKGEEDGKWVTYGGYNYEFTDFKHTDFRMAPNVFDLIENRRHTEGVDSDCDIYISYNKNDSLLGKLGGGESPFTEEELSSTTDPIMIKEELEKMGYKVSTSHDDITVNLDKTVASIKSCKVFVSCISTEYANSNHHRMEIQYAKNSARKPLIPVIVGTGDRTWMSTVVGMLIAGELYIDFTRISKFEEKFGALSREVDTLAGSGGRNGGKPVAERRPSPEKDVFISYCWSNSYLAAECHQVPALSGAKFNDPRQIKTLLEERYGLRVWLDIEQLTSGQQIGMFEQISDGLVNSKCVCAFISTEYARSINCKMEFQFAVKSLRKPFLPIVVGRDNDWVSSVIGALVVGSGHEPRDLLGCESQADLDRELDEIYNQIKGHLEQDSEADEADEVGLKSRAPQIGDHVISHHFKHSYFTATIVRFIKEEMSYEIEWDDGDPTGRVQKYDMVAVNLEPDDDDLGVGQRVFFPQGSYGATEGNNTGGRRYHEGIIDNVEDVDGRKVYSGHHLRGDEDGKWVTYRQYDYRFHDLSKVQLRVAPNAMDVLMDTKKLHG